MSLSGISWPNAKKFAFTIFDDTDEAALEDVREVYSLLLDSGIVTTKSVWTLGSSRADRSHGAACDDPDYVEWLLQIQRKGVEVAYHNASHHPSERERIIEGLDRFKGLFGAAPRSYACHAQCRENIYWGVNRLSTPSHRMIYGMLTGLRRLRYFQGHVEGSKWFWGDICMDNIDYVRNFVFADIDTLNACPIMPYHDPERPFVKAWFASSNGDNVRSFIDCISEEHQDRLEEQGGGCIMYTHFGRGFCNNGVIHPEFARLIRRLSAKGGWFVPVSTLLDYLIAAKGLHVMTDEERHKLERKWLADRLNRVDRIHGR